ncbi:MAG: S9 family peptidase [Bacteroidia bacterium]|nr:MAG: S9 family peptidase [Bacteroidia bacterium]
MSKLVFFFLSIIFTMKLTAQKQVMTPEKLWQLGNTSYLTVSPDKKQILYQVTHINISNEKKTTQFFLQDINTGAKEELNIFDKKNFIQWDANGLFANDKEGVVYKSTDKGKTWMQFATGLKEASNIKIAPDGITIAFSKDVQVQKILGKDIYPQASKSTAQVYTDLNYRHWDTWYEGKVSHVFVAKADAVGQARDLTPDEPYDTPQKPFGGSEDFIFSADSKTIFYVSKKKLGKDYAESTNTDIYRYDIASAQTVNITKGMMGYDVHPFISPDGKYLAFQSMKRDGYEADKNDIIVFNLANGTKTNLTEKWDETADGGFVWSAKSDAIFFNAAIKGTMQLFKVDIKSNKPVQQITNGVFDIASVFECVNNQIIVSKTDMNHAAELYAIDSKNGSLKAITQTNEKVFTNLELSDVKLRMVKTSDNKEMGVWVVYPPNFDPTKKYPTLLYCQGGPQSPVSQFYSTRWNFQLMAANGYIVVAPNRRGLPGWGTAWNEEISGDWGGQAMRDYLAAIDDVAKESYVDKNRLGAVGASYGGYSVYMLAGIHEGRFKSFIAHCGLFDMRSWYGTTEEMFFANFDLKGTYWDQPTPKAYTEFNPSNYVAKWDTPIMVIQGGLDFRVPTEQGLQAFKAAQLKGLKSKLLYFPNENHWVLKAHNGLVWQHEFFNWLKETL